MAIKLGTSYSWVQLQGWLVKEMIVLTILQNPTSMIGENRQLVTDVPVEFEK